MKLEGEGYRITHENGEIKLFGKLSLMAEDYEPIERFFEEAVASGPSDFILDLRGLEYLNSAGIKTLCVNLILEAAEMDGTAMEIRCSSSFTWQKETIPTFEDLMDNMRIVFE